jgi:hypothetical protein
VYARCTDFGEKPVRSIVFAAYSVDEEFMSVVHWMAVAIITIIPWAVSARDKTQDTDPASVTAPATPAGYQSAFAGYQALQEISEPTPENWRSVNDEVGQVGGHAGHIKEATPLPQTAPRNQAPKQESRPVDQHMQHKH